ncbi:MAG: hypothetical protein ACP5GJ_00710 [Nanopusillaceae archaeon]|jgi:hypothetical protein
MEEELLEVIISSIFLIIVTLIGFAIPYLAAEMFQGHNPYLVIEAAGFLTYSTSEPGNIIAAIPMTQFADELLEFRIIPPINKGWIFGSYDNRDFGISIGYCIENNLEEQLIFDSINGLINAVLSYLPLRGSPIETESLSQIASSILRAQVKGYAMGVIENTGALTAFNFISNYGTYGNNIAANFFNSFLSSLETSAIVTGENVVESAVDSVMFYLAGSTGIGLPIAIAADVAINAAITFILYEQTIQNPFAHCYHYNPSSGIYYRYNPILFITIYYNPTFYIYDNCNVYQLCNTQNKQALAYDVGDISNDYIIKIEMGYYDSKSRKYYYPIFLILGKYDQHTGDSLGYITVSIVAGES